MADGGGRPARVVLITGAARGIGAATVAAFVTAGWRVVALDRAADDPTLPYPLATPADLAAVARTAGPDAVRVLRGDARDPAVITAALDLALSEWGGLDAAIAAAGVVAGGAPLWQVSAEVIDTVLSVDLAAVVTLARLALPRLLDRPAPRQGRFLAVASAAATRGLPGLAAYCAAKAGVTGLVRALASELRGSGITANAVSPGSTRTPILAESARLYGLADADAFAVQQPLERLIEPAEVAAALVWLASPDAAAITGTVLAVDGGLSV